MDRWIEGKREGWRVEVESKTWVGAQEEQEEDEEEEEEEERAD